MTVAVLDASVVVKWFVPENHSEKAASVLEGNNELWAPDLIIPETGNIIWKKVIRGEIAAKQAHIILRAITSSPIIINPSAPLAEFALEIACKWNRSVYDCLYLALAVQLDCPMITADEKLYNSLKHTKLKPFVTLVSAL